MSLVHRVLHPEPVTSLAQYVRTRGGEGLRAAARSDADDIIEEVAASGLRGRGGAGFPTGRKWRTVRDNRSRVLRSTVVVNAAEGEPGTFKDRTILRTNPYLVLEGALIAARAVDADVIVVATKRAFVTEVARLREAVAEMVAARWCPGVVVEVFEGPSEYLYGEETALLEAVDGRFPFPRIAPPYRRGVRELVTTPAALGSKSGLSARVAMAGPSAELAAPPAVVDNVETLANVPRILARGADWFRTLGTERSPGTIVCTVSGATRHAGVAEVGFGTPLREVIDRIGGGAQPDRTIAFVMPGVSNGVITAEQLDTPVTYEDLAAIGSGLGSGGFMVFDDTADPVAVAAGVARFLAVESCGQCTPCKLGGLRLAGLLEALAGSKATADDAAALRTLLPQVAESARCSLASQHGAVVGSLLRRFPESFAAHASGAAPGRAPELVAELVDLRDGRVTIDTRHAAKQPDWTYDTVPSGKTPAARLGEHRAERTLRSA